MANELPHYQQITALPHPGLAKRAVCSVGLALVEPKEMYEYMVSKFREAATAPEYFCDGSGWWQLTPNGYVSIELENGLLPAKTVAQPAKQV